MNALEFRNVAVVGLARDTAPDEISSSAVEAAIAPTRARLKLPDGVLAGLTGIRTRRLYSYETQASEAAAKASERLFKETGFDRSRIDLVYSTSVCRDYVEPSTASIVQWRLGLGEEVKGLDIGSACLGFVDGMELAAVRIEAGLSAYALVVAGENSRRLLNATLETLSAPDIGMRRFFQNFASLTLGSGAAAMLLGPADRHPDSPRLKASISLSDAASNHLCRGDQSGMETDSAGLMAAGIALAERTWAAGSRRFGWREDSFAHLICHQVSEANTRKFCKTLGLPEDRLVKTYPAYGNMGPVAVPFTLDLAREQGLIEKGERLALMGIGSGLCCSMMELVW